MKITKLEITITFLYVENKKKLKRNITFLYKEKKEKCTHLTHAMHFCVWFDSLKIFFSLKVLQGSLKNRDCKNVERKGTGIDPIMKWFIYWIRKQKQHLLKVR